MPAPDWAQKMLCIIVPNRRTVSPEFFSWVRTRRLLSRHSCPILGDPGAVSRVGRKGGTKVFKYGRKSPWVPTLTELFPKIQADAASWLGTKNALYYCAQSANNFSWVLFVSSYTTAIVSVTACVAHAPKKCTQWGNFQFDIWYPGALSPVLENFRCALSPYPTDCPWVSEDGCCLRKNYFFCCYCSSVRRFDFSRNLILAKLSENKVVYRVVFAYNAL